MFSNSFSVDVEGVHEDVQSELTEIKCDGKSLTVSSTDAQFIWLGIHTHEQTFSFTT